MLYQQGRPSAIVVSQGFSKNIIICVFFILIYLISFATAVGLPYMVLQGLLTGYVKAWSTLIKAKLETCLVNQLQWRISRRNNAKCKPSSSRIGSNFQRALFTSPRCILFTAHSSARPQGPLAQIWSLWPQWHCSLCWPTLFTVLMTCW